MDPITQGAFGAVFAQTQGNKKNLAKAALIGALAGMAPDLDVLMRSSNDSLLSLEFHRQFTHSLFFIPFGGLICSLVFYPLFGKLFNVSFKQIFVWSIIGFATHGLVDSCTSYGTQLFWPLTDYRVAWDVISIIDPLVTLPLLVLIVLASRKKSRRYIYIAVLWLAIYFGFASYQHQKALDEGSKLAQSRGLNAINIEAKPSFANILVWKIITTTPDEYYIDAVKISLNKTTLWEGDSIKRLNFTRDLPWLDKEQNKYMQQRRDIERFRWFSKGYLALDPQQPDRIIDVRYSLLPHKINALWGIQLFKDSTAEKHVEYYNSRGDSAAASKQLWKMISE